MSLLLSQGDWLLLDLSLAVLGGLRFGECFLMRLDSAVLRVEQAATTVGSRGIDR